MTALLIILAAIALLVIGYVTYGSWLAKEWGVDPSKKTPAVTKEDGVDYRTAHSHERASPIGTFAPPAPRRCTRCADPLPMSTTSRTARGR